jgi:hypothetical protein
MDRLISAADFDRYLVGTKANRPCAACGGTSYDVYDEARTGRRVAVAAFTQPGYTIETALPLETFVSSCAWCGAFRLFYRTKILQWLDAHP